MSDGPGEVKLICLLVGINTKVKNLIDARKSCNRYTFHKFQTNEYNNPLMYLFFLWSLLSSILAKMLIHEQFFFLLHLGLGHISSQFF